jgi:hypothetical protein
MESTQLSMNSGKNLLFMKLREWAYIHTSHACFSSHLPPVLFFICRLLVESMGWGIHAAVVIRCSGMVYGRISSLPAFSQVRSDARRNIINKMIIPMVVCGLSYALRSGYMAADFASRIVKPDTTFEAGVGWWVGNCWLSTLIPSTMLLYSIRKRDIDPGDGDPMTTPLSPHSEAHDDPFQSFQRTFRDYEDEDEVAGSKNPLRLRGFEDQDEHATLLM